MHFFRYAIVCILPIFFSIHTPCTAKEDKTVLLAILARNKEHVLHKYLDCIKNLDYDKKCITLYINTNNNSDNTESILKTWVKNHQALYHNVIFESHTVAGLGENNPHEWTEKRFKVLGKIRNKSLHKTKELGCNYYFVVDCDNFIAPCTLKELIKKNKPIIAPLLKPIPEQKDPYSNYFCDINENGYYRDHLDYLKIFNGEMTGTFEVPVVHCTYLIDTRVIDRLTYIDGTNNYEFVIFSRSARINGVEQYICNEKKFGTLVHFYNNISQKEEEKRLNMYWESTKTFWSRFKNIFKKNSAHS